MYAPALTALLLNRLADVGGCRQVVTATPAEAKLTGTGSPLFQQPVGRARSTPTGEEYANVAIQEQQQ